MGSGRSQWAAGESIIPGDSEANVFAHILSVLETIEVPVSGGPPVILWIYQTFGHEFTLLNQISKMLKLSQFPRSWICMTSSDWNSSGLQDCGTNYLLEKYDPGALGFIRVPTTFYKSYNYTVKSDTLNLVDISMSNCTSSWQLFLEMWNMVSYNALLTAKIEVNVSNFWYFTAFSPYIFSPKVCGHPAL